jgi:hypothetical protein
LPDVVDSANGPARREGLPCPDQHVSIDTTLDVKDNRFRFAKRPKVRADVLRFWHGSGVQERFTVV